MDGDPFTNKRLADFNIGFFTTTNFRYGWNGCWCTTNASQEFFDLGMVGESSKDAYGRIFGNNLVFLVVRRLSLVQDMLM